VPYLSAFAVVIHYEEALYQVYAPLPLGLPFYLYVSWLHQLSASLRTPAAAGVASKLKLFVFVTLLH